MPSITLRARRPFNFLSVVNSHGWRQLAPFALERDVLCYVDRLFNGQVLEYRVSGNGSGIKVETKKTLSKAERAEVAERLRWMFCLDMDFTDFYAASRHEPKLRRAKKQSMGRVLRSPTLFEDVIKTIFTTNTLWAGTRNMCARLVAELGAPLKGDAAKRAFPTPEQIAASSPAAIQDKVRAGYRAPHIHRLGVRVATGELDLESLKHSTMPTLELRKALLQIDGVGPYAAANLLMILGRHDFIPIDSYALSMVSAEWYRGKPVSSQHVEHRFAKWGRHRGLAFWFWDWKEDG